MKEEDMSSDRALDDLVSAWQQQPTSGFRLVPSDVARKIRSDVRHSRWGFWIFLVFFAVAFVLFGALWASQPDPIRRLAHVVELVCIVFFVGQIVVHRQRVRAARFDVDRTTVPSLASARAYLETRRAFHSGKWLWARIALLFPGPPIDIYGQVLTGVMGVAAGWRSLLIWVALLAAVAFIVQRRVAHGYDRQLHELDDIERDSRFQRFTATHYEQWKEPGD
jgi:hypothetical protein